MRISDDESGPTDPLTADLTPVFQLLSGIAGLVLLAAIVVLVVGFVRRRGERPVPSRLTLAAVIAAAVAAVVLVMGIGAGVVVA